MISAGPRGITSWPVRGVAVVILVAALAIAITVALHYRGQAAAAGRQLRSATGPAAARGTSLGLSASTAVLPATSPLSGEVTAFSVRSSSGLARIVVTAQITGGRPDVRYELFGGDCAGDARVRDWAAGTTDAHGSAELTGRPWTVAASHRYFLALSSPGSDHPGPAVHGYFGRPHGLVPVRGGIAPCVP